jgi:hypothetical protein
MCEPDLERTAGRGCEFVDDEERILVGFFCTGDAIQKLVDYVCALERNRENKSVGLH